MTDQILAKLDEIEKRADAATPGPWKMRGAKSICGMGPLGSENLAQFESFHGYETDQSNKLFVVTSRTDVPALAKALRVAVEAMALAVPSLTRNMDLSDGYVLSANTVHQSIANERRALRSCESALSTIHAELNKP